MAKCFRKNTRFRILVRKTNRYFYASLISPDGKMIFSKSTFSYRSDNDKSYNCKSSSYIESLAKDFSDYIREKNLISSVFYVFVCLFFLYLFLIDSVLFFFLSFIFLFIVSLCFYNYFFSS